MSKYSKMTASAILRFILGPFVLLFAFVLLAVLAMCEEIHSWFGGRRVEKKINDWQADREDYLIGKNERI